MPTGAALPQFRSLEEYYPYYLSQHSSKNCRRLHVVGNSIILGSVGAALTQRDARLAALGLAAGYFVAWGSHILFEDGQTALEPLQQATRNPLYGFVCDWRMFADILCGRFVW
ncbi:GPI-anchored surface protein, putative [Bodo saltans]|uniref:GPI-anchored surface protein, putative n=1 Tax=Bodo saltans TaxID=75058 RepID=A0A0S4IVD1_BODSA|nr:GPI-anchored surface protein, putative [Bodo saltans]|eukprot:CUF09665.1 GPI-anchored surface protein, putative [Bodo saltans]